MVRISEGEIDQIESLEFWGLIIALIAQLFVGVSKFQILEGESDQKGYPK